MSEVVLLLSDSMESDEEGIIFGERKYARIEGGEVRIWYEKYLNDPNHPGNAAWRVEPCTSASLTVEEFVRLATGSSELRLALGAEQPLRIIEQGMVGRGRRYQTRVELLSELKEGEQQLFRARTEIEHASVRGSVYTYARRVGKKFSCTRIDPTIICVKRLENPRWGYV